MEIMTLGEFKAAMGGLDDDLLIAFPLDVLGKTVHCGIASVRRVDDPHLGLDEAVFELALDPDVIAGDAALMAKLAERKERLEDYCESICE